MREIKIGFAAASALLLALLVAAAPASAVFGIAEFKGSVLDAADQPYTQAGGHPFTASTTFRLNTHSANGGGESPTGQVRDIAVDLPPGFVGNPTAVPTCPLGDLRDPAIGNGSIPQCAPNTQVGVVEVQHSSTTSLLDGFRTGLFNLPAGANEPARLGFNVAGVVVTIVPELRTGGDYGLTARVRNVNQVLPVIFSTVTLWGVPADPAHDAARGAHCFLAIPLCPKPGNNPFTLEPRAFVTNPTNCSAGPLATGLSVLSWEGATDSAFFDTDVDHGNAPMAVTGCEAVPFDPQIRLTPTTTQADSPTGLDVELTIPQSGLESPSGTAQAHLKRVEVTLPDGMTVNPSSADGLGACTPGQIDLASDSSPTCPESSRIGSVEVETPLLDESLKGSMYLASQGSNPFNSLLALYLVAEGQGLVIKLPGRVTPDPVTGRLRTVFDNNPQLPFSRLSVRFKAGSRAPLATPPTCGAYSIVTDMSSWSAANPAAPAPSEVVTRASSFEITHGPNGLPCPGAAAGLAFSPGFSAGTVLPTGGQFSPFVLGVERPDGQQYLGGGVGVELPPGIIADLKGVPLCSNAQADAGACPAGSRIGTAVVGAGAGATPFFTAPQHGSVFLTEGYRGAPYGLAVVMRAVAGPFDLGTVVVRQSIHVDRVDAHLTAVMGQSRVYDSAGNLTQVLEGRLPTVVEGIPIRLRSVRISVDRPEFTMNPTSCTEKRIKGTLGSELGSVVQPTVRFQTADCRALRFRPRLGLRLVGRRQMRDEGHPGVRAVVRQRAGEAGIRQVRVVLPKSLALDPERAQSDDLCEFADGQKAEPTCPESSIIGRAVAHTPVLNQPLTGPVYFTKNVRIHPRTGNEIRTLPTLVIPLRGEVAINLRGDSAVRRGKLVNTFANVPDAPVSKFQLRLSGGRRGILITNGNLCRRPRSHIADLESDAQSGRRFDRAIRIRTACRRKGAGRKAAFRRKASRSSGGASRGVDEGRSRDDRARRRAERG